MKNTKHVYGEEKSVKRNRTFVCLKGKRDKAVNISGRVCKKPVVSGHLT